MSNLSFDKSTLLTIKLGTALLKALEEHGLASDGHNSFSFSELVGRRNAGAAAKAVRRMWIPFCLNFASRLSPEFQGVKVNFSGGRLHLQKDVHPKTREVMP